jgi:hypothetical protein
MEMLPASVAVQYLDLLNACMQTAAPSGRGLSFVTKQIAGSTHWYLQITIGSRKTQHYLGADTEGVRSRISAEKNRWEEAAPEVRARERLVAALVAGGAPTVSTVEARVLQVLDQSGVFAAGGVLVGSHAFRCYSNMLGVRWQEQADRTLDIDVADTVAVGMPMGDDMALRDRLLGSELEMFEVPALDRKHPSTKFAIRGHTVSVELLTPLFGKPSRKPVLLPNLKAYAEPVRWLDYLLEDAQPAVILAKAGVLTNVPAPGRYALHKLMVAGRRPAHLATKGPKDLSQAAQLLEALLDARPGDLHLAWEALARRSDGLREAIVSQVHKLPEVVTRQLPAVLPQLVGEPYA